MRTKQLILLIILIVLYGCQSATSEVKTEIPATLTPTFLPATLTEELPLQEWQSWNVSAHANTYDSENRSNTYCAKCHSPLNWIPGASADTAAKVSEGEWQSIGCEICHEIKGEQAPVGLATWNQNARQHQPVADSTVLCSQCHVSTEYHNLAINLGAVAHSGFDCVDCHDPHSTAASCTNFGCHESIRPKSSMPPATPEGGQHPGNAAFCGGANCHPSATQAALSNYSIHGAVHASVSCIACHDSSGMPIGPSKELGTWTTFGTREEDETQVLEPLASHTIQSQVDCSRCHFEGNQWGLTLVGGNEFGE